MESVEESKEPEEGKSVQAEEEEVLMNEEEAQEGEQGQVEEDLEKLKTRTEDIRLTGGEPSRDQRKL